MHTLQKNRQVLTSITLLLFLTVLVAASTDFTAANEPFSGFGNGFIVLTLLLALYLSCHLYQLSRSVEQESTLFTSLLHNMPNGVVTYALDEKLTILYANERFFDLIGRSRDEVTREFNNSGLPFAGSVFLFQKILETNATEGPANFDLEFPITQKNGEIIWIYANCYRRRDLHEQDTLSYLMIDITHKKNYESQLLRECNCYSIATALTNDIIFEYDIDTDTMSFSAKYVEIFGRPPVIPDYLNYLRQSPYIHPESAYNITAVSSALASGEETISAELRLLTPKNNYEWFCINGKTIFSAAKTPVKVIGKLSNIEVQKATIDQLQRRLSRDPLTELYNKTATERAIEQALSQLAQKNASQYALMIIDIDNFKNVNDSCGHLVGDEVLQAVAANLGTVFSARDIIGRIGGDEFVVFIRHLATADEIFKKTYAISQSLQTIQPAKAIKISASIGIAFAPQNGLTYRTLLAAADQALYQTKTSGKNHFAIAEKQDSDKSHLSVDR